MHELAIVQRIIAAADTAAAKNKINKVVCIRLKLGQMAAAQPEHLRFCFETYAKGSRLDGAKLIIEEVGVQLACDNCGNIFGDRRFDDADFAHAIAHAPIAYIPPPCSKCGAEGSKITSGNEMELISLEGD